MKLVTLVLALALGAAVLFTGLLRITAQQAKRSYEVATIKPAIDCDTLRPGARGGAGADGTFRMNCVTLESLIVIAYEPPSGGVVTPTSRRTPVDGGPGWIRSQRFDLVAQAQGNPTQVEMRGPMLQSLLEDRFQLVVRRETREGPVYLLTVDRGGLKIQPRTEPCAPMFDPTDPEAMKQLKAQLKAKNKAKANIGACGMSMGQSGPNRIVEFNGTTMPEFAKNLGLNETDRPVIDRTGRPERFNIHLEYSKDVAVGGAAADVPAGPSLFTALQEQLGLRLESGRGPTEVLAVDRAERPSEN